MKIAIITILSPIFLSLAASPLHQEICPLDAFMHIEKQEKALHKNISDWKATMEFTELHQTRSGAEWKKNILEKIACSKTQLAELAERKRTLGSVKIICPALHVYAINS